MHRVTVSVLADDPISEIGVLGVLDRRPEVRVVSPDPIAGREEIADVAVVVTGILDTRTRELLAAVRHQGITRVVLIAAKLGDQELVAAVEAGVVAVVRRAEATADRLVDVVVQAAAGEATLPADVLGRLLGQLGGLQRGDPRSAQARMTTLAGREVEVLRLVADGFDTTQIATRLCYSERTVKNVLHDVTTRLQLRNRSHAVAYAVREGLI